MMKYHRINFDTYCHNFSDYVIYFCPIVFLFLLHESLISHLHLKHCFLFHRFQLKSEYWEVKYISNIID